MMREESIFARRLLSCGSINDPKTARYHLEFIVNNKDKAIFK